MRLRPLLTLLFAVVPPPHQIEPFLHTNLAVLVQVGWRLATLPREFLRAVAESHSFVETHCATNQLLELPNQASNCLFFQGLVMMPPPNRSQGLSLSIGNHMVLQFFLTLGPGGIGNCLGSSLTAVPYSCSASCNS